MNEENVRVGSKIVIKNTHDLDYLELHGVYVVTKVDYQDDYEPIRIRAKDGSDWWIKSDQFYIKQH